MHAAGIVRAALDDVVDLDTWDDVLAVNLRAEAVLVSVLVDALRAAGPGSAIVGISSIEGLIGHGYIPSYVASKHALIGLRGRSRTGSAPTGSGPTPSARATSRRRCSCPPSPPPRRGRRSSGSCPSGASAQPDDIARVVRFLLSDEAAYVNGAAIVVDGGVTAVGGQEALGD